MHAYFGRLHTARSHPDGTQDLASLFALPVTAMQVRFVNLPAPANAAHFFGPIAKDPHG